MLLSCNNTKKVDVTPSFSGAEGEVKLAVLAPGHFHASLLQKNSMQLVFIDIEASTKEKNNIREVGAIDHSNNFVYQ